MSTTVFKRLFEVRILHDYFLTAADGSSFFDRNEADRKKLLNVKFSRESYKVQKLLRIRPDRDTTHRLKEYKLILRETPLGFVAGLEVEQELKAGEILYKPRIELPAGLRLAFTLTPVLPVFKSITSIVFNPQLPAIYYFTNKSRQVFSEPAAPGLDSLVLSVEAPEHQQGKRHEMGALASFGGTLREALQHTDGNDPAHWQNTADRRYVSEADRILLPAAFNYILRKEENVTQFVAILEDQSGQEVKRIPLESLNALSNVFLDFTTSENSEGETIVIPTGLYKLKISLNEGPDIIWPILLDPALYRSDALGVVDIRLDETGSPFSLLDGSGYLKTRIDAAGQSVSHPVFEIRLRNRRTYWRYRKTGDFSAGEAAETADHLELQDGKLVSKNPKALTETLVPFQNGSIMTLPHPPAGPVRVETGKIFSDIHIHPANRLLKD